VWRDFAHGIVVKRPDKAWVMHGADEARAIHPGAAMLMTQGEASTFLQVDAAEALDLAGHHARATKAMQAQLAVTTSGPSKGTLGGTEALISYGTIGNTRRARVATAIHRGHSVSLFSWANPLEEAALDRLAASVTLAPALPAVDSTADVYRDHRLGFALRPPAGWLREDITPPELAPMGTLVRWQLEGRWFAVAAVGLQGNAARRSWMVGFLEQLLRDALAPDARGSAQHEAIVFAERPAIHVSWRAALMRVDALVITRDGVVYGLVAVDHGDDALNLLQGGFSLLP
jgi:hypothetical protein